MLPRSRYGLLALSIGVWTVAGCAAGSGSGGSAIPVAQDDGGNAGTGTNGADTSTDGADTNTDGADTTTDGSDMSTDGGDISTDGGDQDAGTNGQDDDTGSPGPGVILNIQPLSPAVGQIIFLTCLVTEPTESPATSFEFFSTTGGGEIIQDGSSSASAIIPAGLFTINYQCQAQSPAGPGPLSPIVIVNIGG